MKPLHLSFMPQLAPLFQRFFPPPAAQGVVGGGRAPEVFLRHHAVGLGSIGDDCLRGAIVGIARHHRVLRPSASHIQFQFAVPRIESCYVPGVCAPHGRDRGMYPPPREEGYHCHRRDGRDPSQDATTQLQEVQRQDRGRGCGVELHGHRGPGSLSGQSSQDRARGLARLGDHARDRPVKLRLSGPPRSSFRSTRAVRFCPSQYPP